MTKGDTLRVMDYLAHMVEAIDRINLYVDDMTPQAFLEDQKTQDAVVRNFEVAGEAAHNVEVHHATFAASHPDVPWALMYTMRTASPMGISRWTMNWCGRPSMVICHSYAPKSSH